MLEVKNVEVYDLKPSVIACRNAMRLEMPQYTEEEFQKSLKRAITLANSRNGSGHQTFLSGIRVSFDLRYPNYISPELQRYHFFDIVTSSSKMHKLLNMNLDYSCNEYTSMGTIRIVEEYVEKYNKIKDDEWIEGSSLVFELRHSVKVAYNKQDALYYAWMQVLSNCPQGIELFMRCSTNYLQLKTIYGQRRNHKLKEDWGAFCKFVESLPYAKELIIGYHEKDE